MKKWLKPLLWIWGIPIVAIQFFQIDKTNPHHDITNDFMTLQNPPSDIAEMLKNACYDCHSNLTEYPWYTCIQPAGSWVQGHIYNARGELNFSEWQQYNDDDKPRGLEGMAEQVSKKKMPLTSYTLAHSAARLNMEERRVLSEWFISQTNGWTKPPNEAEIEENE